MNKDELFEVMKGNIRLISLNDIIQHRMNKLENFCMTHYTEDDIKRFEQRKQNYILEHADYWYDEPKFPPGNKRVLSKKYNTLLSSVRNAQQLRNNIIELAFEDYQDSGDYYEVDNIIVRKT
jgi:hypothetical protein